MNAARVESRIVCTTCPHACKLGPGEVGFCRSRGWRDGQIRPLAYGHITSYALDPVEKKPLAEWMSGKQLLSVGSYGCNLRCPFCQNHQISQVGADDIDYYEIPPGQLVDYALASHMRDDRVIGVAHTYNEPLLNAEYVADTGMLAHRVGLMNVIVSNGYANPEVVHRVAPLVDAANIDLKGFTEDYYRWCGGDLATVQQTIRILAAQSTCHLEVTCLIVEGKNDSPSEMRALSSWLASVDSSIVLHVTRCFPQWKMQGARPTPRETVFELADVAREALGHVYVGNV